MVGKQVACPHCRGHVQIPDSTQAEAGAETPNAPRGMQGFEDRIPDPPTIPHATSAKPPSEASSNEQLDSRSDTGEPVASDPMAPVAPNTDLSEDDASEYDFCPSAVAVVESGTQIEVEEHPRTIIHKGARDPTSAFDARRKKTSTASQDDSPDFFKRHHIIVMVALWCWKNIAVLEKDSGTKSGIWSLE